MIITIQDSDWAELKRAIESTGRSSIAKRAIQQAIDSTIGVLATLAGERSRWIPDNAPIDDHSRCARLTMTLRKLRELRLSCGNLSLIEKLSQLFSAVCRKLAARSSVELAAVYNGLVNGALPPAHAVPSAFWSRRPGLDARTAAPPVQARTLHRVPAARGPISRLEHRHALSLSQPSQ